MEFFSFDVETANIDLASICQIGIAHFKDGVLTGEWKSYVDPEDYFDDINISIHGINESAVVGAPNLPAIIGKIHEYLDDHITVCHTHFDRIAIYQASEKYGVKPPATSWLDSALVVRRTWEQFAWHGYGLQDVCNYLGYQFKHHDALEDAKASGYILISAINKSGLDIDAWQKRVKQPIDPDPTHSSIGKNIERDGDPEGPLYGEVLVFTGALSIHRDEAADLAAKIGCRVETGVNKKTTLLVVGDQDIRRLAGHEKSNKHRKAEVLIATGQPIRILRETDFRELANI